MVEFDPGRLSPFQSKLLVVEGTCLGNDSRRFDDLSVRFSLAAFGYRILGTGIPPASLVSRFLLEESCWLTDPSESSLLGMFDPEIEVNLIPSDHYCHLGDLEVYSLASRFRTLTINTWQYFRGYDPPFGLSIHFSQMNCKLGHDNNSWFYMRENQRIAVGYDWRLGSMERQKRNSFPPAWTNSGDRYGIAE